MKVSFGLFLFLEFFLFCELLLLSIFIFYFFRKLKFLLYPLLKQNQSLLLFFSRQCQIKKFGMFLQSIKVLYSIFWSIQILIIIFPHYLLLILLIFFPLFGLLLFLFEVRLIYFNVTLFYFSLFLLWRIFFSKRFFHLCFWKRFLLT